MARVHEQALRWRGRRYPCCFPAHTLNMLMIAHVDSIWMSKECRLIGHAQLAGYAIIDANLPRFLLACCNNLCCELNCICIPEH